MSSQLRFAVCFFLSLSTILEIVTAAEPERSSAAYDHSTTTAVADDDDNDDRAAERCRQLLNETRLELLTIAPIRLESTKKKYWSWNSNPGLKSPDVVTDDDCRRSSWSLECQEWSEHSGDGHCRLSIHLNITLIGRTKDGADNQFFSLSHPHWMMSDAVLTVEAANSIHIRDDIVLPSLKLLTAPQSSRHSYRCVYSRQVAGETTTEQSPESDKQVVADERLGCLQFERFNDGMDLQIGMAVIVNRSDELKWEKHDLVCTRNESINKLTDLENERNEWKISQKVLDSNPDSSTIAVTIAFGFLVVVIVIGYFLVKIRQQEAPVPYSTMSND